MPLVKHSWTTVTMLAFLFLLLSSAMASAVIISSDTVLRDETLRAVTHDLSQRNTFTYVVLTACTIDSSGLTIAGKEASKVASTDVGVSYTAITGTLQGPVTFTNSIVPNSMFSFSAMIASTFPYSGLFVLSTGTFTYNTSFTFSDITASWAGSTSGSVVTAPSSFAVAAKSAIFITGCTLTNAQGALSVSPTTTNVASVTDGSVVAVDRTTCTGCTTALINVMVPLTVSGSSLFRVCDNEGGTARLVRQEGAVTVSDKSLYTVSDSSATSALFSYVGTFTVTGSSAVSFKALTGGSTGVSNLDLIPTTVEAGSTSYGDDACVFGGTPMSSTTTFANNGLNVMSYSTNSTCSAAKCVPGASTGASVSTSASGTSSCDCTCAKGTEKPYCTYMRDPLIYPKDPSGTGTCTLFKCAQCSISNATLCDGCESGYMLVSGGCVVNCSTENCAACDTNAKCTTCNSGYMLTSGSCLACNVDNCTACSAENYCSECTTDMKYTLIVGKCVLCDIANCAACSAPNVCLYDVNGDSASHPLTIVFAFVCLAFASLAAALF